HAFEQHVAAGDQGGQGSLHDVVLADDHLGDLLPQPQEVRAELVELGLDRLGAHLKTPHLSANVTNRRLRSGPTSDNLSEVIQAGFACQTSLAKSAKMERPDPGNVNRNAPPTTRRAPRSRSAGNPSLADGRRG